MQMQIAVKLEKVDFDTQVEVFNELENDRTVKISWQSIQLVEDHRQLELEILNRKISTVESQHSSKTWKRHYDDLLWDFCRNFICPSLRFEHQLWFPTDMTKVIKVPSHLLQEENVTLNV